MPVGTIPTHALMVGGGVSTRAVDPAPHSFSLLDPDPHSISRSVSRREKFKGKNPPKDARKLVIIEF